jgi:anti-sigma factor RsiW
MKPTDLLDYALGRLEAPRRERLERRMASDPALAERMARLVRNLGRLLDDGRGDLPAEGRPPASPTDPAIPGSARAPGPEDQANRSPSTPC